MTSRLGSVRTSRWPGPRLRRRPSVSAGPAIAADASGEFGKLRVELVNVALAPAGDLAVGGDAELLQHALEHRTDANDELQVVGRADPEKRRRRVVFEIDDELPVARAFATRGRELAVQAAAVHGEVSEMHERRIARNASDW